jgi:DNA-binding response OmpR family regulator
VAALKQAKFDPARARDPLAALAMLQQSPFDLVLLDIIMPGIDGFEVCEQMRRMPQHRTTPVIFLTLHGEFQNRVRSVLAGGNDLITKPISPIELTLKVTIQMPQQGAQRTAAPPAGDVVKATEDEAQLMAQVLQTG